MEEDEHNLAAQAGAASHGGGVNVPRGVFLTVDNRRAHGVSLRAPSLQDSGLWTTERPVG